MPKAGAVHPIKTDGFSDNAGLRLKRDKVHQIGINGWFARSARSGKSALCWRRLSEEAASAPLLGENTPDRAAASSILEHATGETSRLNIRPSSGAWLAIAANPMRKVDARFASLLAGSTDKAQGPVPTC